MFGKIKISHKVAAILFLLTAVTTGFGAYSIYVLKNKTQLYQINMERSLLPLVHLTSGESKLNGVGLNVRSLLVLTDINYNNPKYSEVYHSLTNNIFRLKTDYYKDLAAFAAHTRNDELSKSVNDLKSKSDLYFSGLEAVLANLNQGHTEGLKNLLMDSELPKMRQEISAKIEHIQDQEEAYAENLSGELTSEIQSSVKLGIVVIFLVLVFSGVVSFLIYRNINMILARLSTELRKLVQTAADGELKKRADIKLIHFEFRPIVEGINQILDSLLAPIDDASRILERISNRNLTEKMLGDYKGDQALIKLHLNKAVDNLHEALVQVSKSAIQVSSASGQISAGSQSLAQGSNEQASSLEEISASLAEISQKLKLNLDNTGLANEAARSAKDAAEKGNEAMSQMSMAMEKIKQSADQTARILKTIDEIAFQTNLLALNAAVEAARAGEAGKGFAVVAEEVRNLAQRSAEAARNTSTLIEVSQENASEGVTASNQVGLILKQIVGEAQKVATLIEDISLSAQEQSKGVEQINIGVTELNKVTQQNSALSEESASSAEQLNAQAEELKQLISSFELTESAKGDSVNSHQGDKSSGRNGAEQKTKMPLRLIKNSKLIEKEKEEPSVGHNRSSNVLVVANKGVGAGPARAFNAKEIAIPLTDEELRKF